MFDISCTLWCILHATGVTGQPFLKPKGLVQVRASSRRHIEHLPSHFLGGSGCRQEVGVHGIVNVGEISALSSITKDGRLLAQKHLADELCKYAGVGRSGILPRAINVEVA